MERLDRSKTQVGVKEIRNHGWENYWRHFPNMKVILTSRDPRDIYISTYFHRKRHGKADAVTPQAIAKELKKEFRIQLQIKERTEHFQVRYEDFCQDPQLVEKVKRFVNSPVSETGQVGQFNVKHPIRRKEAQEHGNQITTKRVSRWQHEENTALVQDALRCFELMPAYTEFWNYEL